MLRLFFVIGFGGSATAAHAHFGHLGEVAGHDHVVAGVAIGIAIALGLREALKGKSDPKDDSEDAEEEATA